MNFQQNFFTKRQPETFQRLIVKLMKMLTLNISSEQQNKTKFTDSKSFDNIDCLLVKAGVNIWYIIFLCSGLI